VRLEDVDGDDIPEIIAADNLTTGSYTDNWIELNNMDQVYKWNGAQFSFWKNVPRDSLGNH
jgi:hypothetical protein